MRHIGYITLFHVAGTKATYTFIDRHPLVSQQDGVILMVSLLPLAVDKSRH